MTTKTLLGSTFIGGPLEDGSALDGSVPRSSRRDLRRKTSLIDDMRELQAKEGFVPDADKYDRRAPNDYERRQAEDFLEQEIEGIDQAMRAKGYGMAEDWQENEDAAPGLAASTKSELWRAGHQAIDRMTARDFAKARKAQAVQQNRRAAEHTAYERGRAVVENMTARWKQAAPDLQHVSDDVVEDYVRRQVELMGYTAEDFVRRNGEVHQDNVDDLLLGVARELREAGYRQSATADEKPSSFVDELADLQKKSGFH